MLFPFVYGSDTDYIIFVDSSDLAGIESDQEKLKDDYWCETGFFGLYGSSLMDSTSIDNHMGREMFESYNEPSLVILDTMKLIGSDELNFGNFPNLYDAISCVFTPHYDDTV